ncbi:MAG TPA: aldo/keto reductase [Stellaceae bacterium]|nr:aldo/keto reductase [Stellaceae bacterium]
MDNLTGNGMVLPRLGLGTYRMQGDACRKAVETALELGYRHIDTAEMYGNEDAVGAALATTSVPRSEIKVTSKVWYTNLAPDAMRRAHEGTLTKLGTDYVDLYLIHWPGPDMNLPQALETLMKIREEGGAKAIGVANFTVALLKQTIEDVKAPIACNQVEYHVLLGQDTLRNYMREHGLALTAYCPLAQGRLAEHRALDEIGRKHNVSAAQVALAWLLNHDGVAAIPKAGRIESQKANLEALKLRLDAEDMAAIATLPKKQRCVSPGFAPHWD